jgi:hypothetical protein
MPRRDPVLEELWETAPIGTRTFDPAAAADLPPAARRYLLHALAPGTTLPRAVRLTMQGTIRLGGAWHRFTAEQVSRWGRGFVWRARARMRGLPVSGFDRLVDGVGLARWRMLGLFTVMHGEGPDTTRSAAGRVNGEAIWMPGTLLEPEVELLPGTEDRVEGIVHAHGDDTRFWLELSTTGSVEAAGMDRWGAPDQGGYQYHPFGGIIEDEATFAGIAIPTRVRMGWHFGSDRFAVDGEFFRAEIIAAQFR